MINQLHYMLYCFRYRNVLCQKTCISVKSTTFYPYFGFHFHLYSCQSRDKMLQILLRFVLYSAMMVAIALARQIGQCWQVHVFHLVSLLFIARINPYSLFKIRILKLFLLYILTCSVTDLHPISHRRSHSYVSPSNGLNGFPVR